MVASAPSSCIVGVVLVLAWSLLHWWTPNVGPTATKHNTMQPCPAVPYQHPVWLGCAVCPSLYVRRILDHNCLSCLSCLLVCCVSDPVLGPPESDAALQVAYEAALWSLLELFFLHTDTEDGYTAEVCCV